MEVVVTDKVKSDAEGGSRTRNESGDTFCCIFSLHIET